MARSESVRDYPCPVAGRVVRVHESYHLASSGACPVSSALDAVHCDAEAQCRAADRFNECRLWDEYEPFFG